jgi:hypothetical protein
MKDKILFYGASVTVQKGREGYFDVLSKKLESSYHMERVVYGGASFDNAGDLSWDFQTKGF